ncbi:MAG TPA: DUF4191 domain-containing protein [Mycobacteriales bacterium]|nr:DUF4191 domain-containing protein [Mycobacteriales bacterium]
MARSKTPTSAPAKRTSGKAADKAADKDAKPGRIQQVRQVWSMTRQQDPKAVPIILGSALLVLAVFVVIGILIGQIVLFSILAVMAALLAGTSIFGRRATKSMYAQVEGRPGAAAAVLQGMRGDWRVTPAVGFTRNQELVHRVIGRPGIVLVGEGGSAAAIKSLMVDQKRRIGRVAPDTPIHELIVGDGEGMIPISKLQQKVTRLPRALKKGEVSALEARMKALGGPNVPMPKGPMPTRVPRGKLR